MPYNPAGLFSLVVSYLAQPGTTIRTEQHNPPLEDIGSALSSVLIRDGRAPMTGPLNMNGFPINNIAAGSSPTSVATVAQAMPVGSVIDFAGASAPSGWMLCFGQAVSRTTYATLFAVIGTVYGAGDGSTTFNLPDCRGFVTAGRDDMGGAAAGRLTTALSGTTLGASGGAQNVALSIAQMPVHKMVGTTKTNNISHHHAGVVVGGSSASTGGGAFSAVGSLTTGSTGAEDTAHVHPFESDPIGSGATHNNVQPTIIMNKIIRASYNV